MYLKTTLNLLSSENIELYIPETVNTPVQVIYVLDGEKFTSLLAEYYTDNNIVNLPVLVSLNGKNRINDYTPWKADSLVGHFPDFGGKGDEFISHVEKDIIPAVSAAIAEHSGAVLNIVNVLAGYSLGGLLSTYAGYKTAVFSKIVSVSGSFWYPNWDEFIAENTPVKADIEFIMMYGENEGKGKISAQGQMVERSQLTFETIRKTNKKTSVTVDDGGHHDNVSKRWFIAADQLVKKIEF